MNEVIKLHSVNKWFGEYRVLKDVGLSVSEKEVVAIVGKTGSGKTTLLRIISALDFYFVGERCVVGKCGYMFQQPMLLPWMTVSENLHLYIQLNSGCLNKIKMVVEFLGIGHLLQKFCWELSGGQLQLSSLGVILASDPQILLLDEPFSSVDEPTRTVLGAKMTSLRDSLAKTIVFTTHSIEEAVVLSDKILLINNGSIEEIKIQLPKLIKNKTLYNDCVQKYVADIKQIIAS